jgi:hypothetical protein
MFIEQSHILLHPLDVMVQLDHLIVKLFNPDFFFEVQTICDAYRFLFPACFSNARF